MPDIFDVWHVNCIGIRVQKTKNIPIIFMDFWKETGVLYEIINDVWLQMYLNIVFSNSMHQSRYSNLWTELMRINNPNIFITHHKSSGKI